MKVLNFLRSNQEAATLTGRTPPRPRLCHQQAQPPHSRHVMAEPTSAGALGPARTAVREDLGVELDELFLVWRICSAIIASADSMSP